MSIRFVFSILVLLLGLGLVVYGLDAHSEKVFQKPDPRDDPSILLDEYAKTLGEIELTSLVSRMSLARHEETNELVDLANNAPCQS